MSTFFYNRLPWCPWYKVHPLPFDETVFNNDPMPHQDMIEQSLLYYASRADSSLQKKYQEPCVVFAGHPSLRSGAAINFIRKWGNNSNNSIIFTGLYNDD